MKNTVTFAAFLEQHNNIEKVFYPNLETHPNHKVAKQQMTNSFGSIISILVKKG